MTYQTQPGTLPHRAIEYLKEHHANGSEITNAELAEALDTDAVTLLSSLQVAKRAGAILGAKQGNKIRWSLGEGTPDVPEDFEEDRPLNRRGEQADSPAPAIRATAVANAFTTALAKRPASRHEPPTEPPQPSEAAELDSFRPAPPTECEEAVMEDHSVKSDTVGAETVSEAQQDAQETSNDAGLQPDEAWSPGRACPIPDNPPPPRRDRAVYGWFSDGTMSIEGDGQFIQLSAEEAQELMGFARQVAILDSVLKARTEAQESERPRYPPRP